MSGSQGAPRSSADSADAGEQAGSSRSSLPERGSEAPAGSAEAARTEPARSGGGGAPPAGDASSGTPPGTVQTSGERQAGLDERLQESLEEFDGALTKEQEALAKRREETAAATAAARESGGSASSSGSYGEYGESSSYGDTGSSGEQATSSSAGGTETTGGSRDVASAGGAQPRSTGGRSSTPPPAGIPDGADDDIVARQLREAAMSEDDPELREKLWEEYRVYKTGKKSTAETAGESADEKPADETEETGKGQDPSQENAGDDEQKPRTESQGPAEDRPGQDPRG